MRAGNWGLMAEPGPEPSRTETTNGEANEPAWAWLTYAAAGERFGLSADAVRMRAKRLGWRTQPGNDGRTLVWIEGTAPEPAPEHGEHPHEQAEQTGAALLPQAVAALEAAVTLLGEQLAGAEARAAGERERALAERERANRLLERLDVAEAKLVVKAAALEQARADAGAAAEAADARAGRAERAGEEERQRAEAINALLEATQEELAGQRALTDQARVDAEKAHAQADVLRQAEVERQARGRWARLRAAWRGQ
jgi:hypothetical protein